MGSLTLVKKKNGDHTDENDLQETKEKGRNSFQQTKVMEYVTD